VTFFNVKHFTSGSTIFFSFLLLFTYTDSFSVTAAAAAAAAPPCAAGAA